jgi:hypothetical protein
VESVTVEKVEPLPENKYIFVPEFDNDQVDSELANIMEEMSIAKNSDDINEDLAKIMCHCCRGIIAVGPALISKGNLWPPKGAKVLYS